ncbi:carboxymuconolactone decarboxylase family protein [Synechocystis sp. PCC 7509]|uniref:carboxymuconolactone decarboxylase family protein n=1 Tax=Synechocystis sp. PCC 7509 TaxID=927677 RepID=UPI0002AC6492|nr:carboxymuconolactone decarboxylase family protein [Synechocystis sp. PCC 7509]
MLNVENKAAIVTRANSSSESISYQRGQARYWKELINKAIAFLSCIAIALPVAATAQTPPENQSRRKQGNQVINKLSGGAGQPVLEGLRQDFPFLADAIVDYSLGEVWSRSELDDRTRQLAAVAAFAAQGNLPQLKIHAGYALRLGVTQNELKEIVYLTTVTAGFPRSIDAAQALREVFAAQSSSPSTTK